MRCRECCWVRQRRRRSGEKQHRGARFRGETQRREVKEGMGVPGSAVRVPLRGPLLFPLSEVPTSLPFGATRHVGGQCVLGVTHAETKVNICNSLYLQTGKGGGWELRCCSSGGGGCGPGLRTRGGGGQWFVINRADGGWQLDSWIPGRRDWGFMWASNRGGRRAQVLRLRWEGRGCGLLG